MATIDSLNALLVEELRDIYDAEKRLTKAIPKLAKAAANADLRTALEGHLKETRGQIDRLEKAFAYLGEKAKGKPCAGMKGILEEGDEHVNEDYDDDDLRDAVIIGSAQRVEHYEIAAYGTAIAHAKLLGHDKIVQLLVPSMNEEKAADEKLTRIAEGVVNLEAAADDEESAGEGAFGGFFSRKTATVTQRSTAAASSRGSKKKTASKPASRARRSR
jgi:ferritin-like metal-binding protein YciE